MESIGPATITALATRLALPQNVVESAMAKLEAGGQVLRGRFTPRAKAPDTEMEWCNRRLLARIHRLTLGRLRKEIEPVASADFLRFLFTWQHVAPGTQLHGADGVLQIVRQLQGYEISAAAWESEVLKRRVARYTPDLLDRLCLSGEVMWGRLSPHPSLLLDDATLRNRRIRPTRVAPVAIFLREDASWLLESPPQKNGLSQSARDVAEALQRRGASFLPELVQATGQLTSQVEDGLWELAAAGLVLRFVCHAAAMFLAYRLGLAAAAFKRVVLAGVVSLVAARWRAQSWEVPAVALSYVGPGEAAWERAVSSYVDSAFAIPRASAKRRLYFAF